MRPRRSAPELAAPVLAAPAQPAPAHAPAARAVLVVPVRADQEVPEVPEVPVAKAVIPAPRDFPAGRARAAPAVLRLLRQTSLDILLRPS